MKLGKYRRNYFKNYPLDKVFRKEYDEDRKTRAIGNSKQKISIFRPQGLPIARLLLIVLENEKNLV